MSRIRTVKPEFFLDEELAELTPLNRLLFIGLWTLADCEGRLEDRPKRIRAQLHPYDDGDTDAMLQALHDAGFIIRYTAEGMRCIEVRSFKKHQRLSSKEVEGQSQLPPRTHPGQPKDAPGTHPGQPKDAPGTHPGHTGDAPGTHPGHDGTIPDAQEEEGKGKEGKGKEGEQEGKGNARARKTPLAPISPNWQPSPQALDILSRQGIPNTFAKECIPEFRLYWAERGDARPGWDASFVSSVKRSWDKRPMPTAAHRQDQLTRHNQAAITEWLAQDQPIIEGEVFHVAH